MLLLIRLDIVAEIVKIPKSKSCTLQATPGLEPVLKSKIQILNKSVDKFGYQNYQNA